ncbi:MAG: sigma-70 region 2 domain protein, partial [Marmoricola sp.]|nr:sigma-70 region 2 domain protein [Marmoricola sp.]
MSAPDVQAPVTGAHELTDPELISRVREGDVAAYGILFSRHVDAATRLARLLVDRSDADDLVSEAFVKVLNVLLGGGGPDVAFRAYLLTAVRRLHIDKVRGNQRLTTTGDLTPYDSGVPFTDTAVAGFEGGAAAKAFASLPERWQLVLWHLEVENQKPADIAPLLGMTPNSVSALAYRAREGLRQAFLNMHAGDLVSDACRQTTDMLGGYVRGGLSRRDSSKVEGHLEHCRRCTAVYLELSEVNSSLAALLGPAVLGSAAAAYLGGGAAATGLGTGLVFLLSRGRDVVLGHTSAAAATAGVVGVAGISAVA